MYVLSACVFLQHMICSACGDQRIVLDPLVLEVIDHVGAGILGEASASTVNALNHASVSLAHLSV